MLALRLLRLPDGQAPLAAPRPIDEHGVTIGRSPDCQVVLEDPLRGVSRQHAWLGSRGTDAALVRCISATAPLTLNGQAVAPGAERMAKAGDVLRIGGFELRLEDDDLTTIPVVSRARRVVTEGGMPGPAAASAVDLPLEMSPAARPDAARSALDLELPAATRDARVEGTFVMRRPPAATPNPLADPMPRPPFRRSRLDEWFELDTAPDPLGPQSPLPSIGTTGGYVGTPATMTLDPERTVMAAPRGAAQASPPARVSAPVVPLREAADAAARARGATPAGSASSSSPSTPIAGGPRAPALDAVALRRAFLRGAGLPESASTSALAVDEAWMAHLGAVLRASTDGTLALLRSRAVAKRSIRAEGTRIAAQQNNPLKFVPDAGEALALLLRIESPGGYLSPVQAVHDAHADLQIHQMAMTAGMHAAVVELVAQLGPAPLEQAEGPARGLARWFPVWRDARLWRAQRRQHAELMSHLDESFEAIFGREFVRAYEAQSREGVPGAAIDSPAAPLFGRRG